MKRFRKGTSFFILLLMLISVLAACNNVDKEDNKNNTSKELNNSKQDKDMSVNDKLSGSLTISGSTSMEKLAKITAEAFMNKYSNVTVSTEFVGSSAGVEQVLAGAVDIGNASRSLKDSEKEAGAVENIVAIDCIAVIVDKSNTINNLTKDQLIGIYIGTIKNWSELGGSNLPIVVVGRESGSGTRGAFEEILGIEDQANYSNEINSTGGVIAKVASIPGAIGYVSLDVVDNSVNIVSIDGVEATADNIKEGNYLLSRPFVMATDGQISEQNDIVKAFFEFISSEEGKEIVSSIGLITVD